MKSWSVLVAVMLLGAGCDVGGGNLTGTGGGTLPTGAGGATIMTGSGGGIVTGGGGAAGAPEDPCGKIYPTTRVLPDVLIVLDTSTSMNDGFGGPCAGGCGMSSKWAQAVAAILSVTDAPEPSANWGLQLFTNGGNACTAASVVIPAVPTAATGIRSVLVRSSAGGQLLDPGNSPTRAAIETATRHLLGRTSIADAAILLVTDGEPECAKGASDLLASDAAGAVEAVTYARTAGFPTLVAGITPDAETALSAMAQAGGLPRDGSPAFHPVSNPDDLVSAMDLLTAQMACTYAVPPAPTNDGRTSRGNIAVFIDGSEIWQDANDGWTYRDSSQAAVQFHGKACDTAHAGGSVSVIFHTICP